MFLAARCPLLLLRLSAADASFIRMHTVSVMV
jgi:hypothetical protein